MGEGLPATAGAIKSNITADGERRDFRANGYALLAEAGGMSALKGRFEPGWRWSTDLGPVVGTSSCQVRHLGYMISGRMAVRMDDGTEIEAGPGDLFDLAPGHDAWVVGDEAAEMLDVSAAALTYATSRAAELAAPDNAQMSLVRKGYAAFNTGDIDTLRSIMTSDVCQHVPGSAPLAGTYKGVDNVLGYYGKLFEMTGGTFRASLMDVHGDGAGHVIAIHQISAVRDGVKRISRGSILFTFIGEKASDLLELHGDLPGDDAFLA